MSTKIEWCAINYNGMPGQEKKQICTVPYTLEKWAATCGWDNKGNEIIYFREIDENE